MVKLIRIKNNNGTIYLYENETTCNKELKKYQYKRSFIGKITKDGKTIILLLK